MKFRKKPVVIEAVQLTWANWNEVCEFVGDVISDDNSGYRISAEEASDTCGEDGPEYIAIKVTTTHGEEAVVRHGDWIIPDSKPGTFYPCKPDVFAATYDFEPDEENNEETDMEFKQFIRKPFVVEAIEVTRENIYELSDLIGEFGEDENGPYINADIENRLVPTVYKVTPGYWVTKMGRNIRCYSARVFSEQFTETTDSLDRLMRKIDEDAKVPIHG